MADFLYSSPYNIFQHILNHRSNSSLMNDTENSSDRATRLKRLKYRANHRGIKEMDIVIGRFANEMIEGLSDENLDLFEELMAEHDRDLIIWFTGEQEFPDQKTRPMFEMVRDHMNSYDFNL